MVYREEKKNNGQSVFYGLTEHGKSLDPLIVQIVLWGEKHRKIVIGKLLKKSPEHQTLMQTAL